MRISAWDHSVQLQFLVLRSSHIKYLIRNGIKNMLISLVKK